MKNNCKYICIRRHECILYNIGLCTHSYTRVPASATYNVSDVTTFILDWITLPSCISRGDRTWVFSYWWPVPEPFSARANDHRYVLLGEERRASLQSTVQLYVRSNGRLMVHVKLTKSNSGFNLLKSVSGTPRSASAASAAASKDTRLTLALATTCSKASMRPQRLVSSRRADCKRGICPLRHSAPSVWTCWSY